MGRAVHQWVWFADAQKSRIQVAKPSEVGSADKKDFDLLMLRNCVFKHGIVHIPLVPSCWCSGIVFETAKLPDICCAKLKEGRLGTSQESHFQAAKRFDMSSAILQEGRLTDAQKSRFQGAKHWNNRQFCPAMRLICWCSGIPYSDCETFRNGQWRFARSLICWCSGIAYSGCETVRYEQCRHERLRFADFRNRVFRVRNIEIIGSTVQQ